MIKLLFISVFHLKVFGLVPFLKLKTSESISFILFIALFRGQTHCQVGDMHKNVLRTKFLTSISSKNHR